MNPCEITTPSKIPCVLEEKKKGVLTLVLNRPKALNALNLEMMEALSAAFDRALSPDVFVVVLKASGDNFMAGGDIRLFHETLGLSSQERGLLFKEFVGKANALILQMRALSKPIVVAVQGAVAGYGVSLVMAADFAIATKGCYLTLAYNRLGLSPDGGASFFLPRVMGARKAFEMISLGEKMGAQAAKDWGIFNEVIEESRFEEDVDLFVEGLQKRSLSAFAAVKTLLGNSVDKELVDQLKAEEEAFSACSMTDDFVEGVTAFLEKRNPIFNQGK